MEMQMIDKGRGRIVCALFTLRTLTLEAFAAVVALSLPMTALPASWEDVHPEQVKAFERGDLAAVKRIIKQDPDFENPYMIREGLHHAIRSGNVDLIRYLKTLGWIDECRAARDCYPLHSGAGGGWHEHWRDEVPSG
jgi:hypothetical protein